MNRILASIPCLGLAIVLALAGPAALPARAATRALVVTTNFGVSGGACDVSDAAPWTPHPGAATVGSDAVARWYGGRFYVVNRSGGDNVQVLDPSPSWHTALQFSVGVGSNPHDIAFVSPTKAYVTRYDSADLWIVNPQSGAHTGTLSLAAFADADGLPEMDQAVVVGHRLFVSLQLLDRDNFYAPTGPGKLAVIDVDADTLLDADPVSPGRQAVALTGANPTTTLEFNRSDLKLYVGETGNYGVRDGGIEAVDPVTLRAGGFAVREDSLGGDVNQFRFTGPSSGFVIVSDDNFNTVLARFDLATHRRTGTPYAPAGFVLADVAADDAGQVWVADRTRTAPGIRIFAAATGDQLTSTPIPTGLDPYSVAFDMSVSTTVPAPARSGVLAVRAPGGAIFARGVDFEVSGGQGPRRARLLDASGRLVRAFDLPAGPAAARLAWDGAGPGGSPAPSGVFWLRVECGREAATARVVKVR